MKIKERPEFASKPKPLTGLADESVASAVKKMSERNFGSTVVVDESGRILGLVTERDIMRRLVDQGRDATTTTLRDIMTSEIRVAREDDEILDWLRIMSNERFRRLPVVDADKKVVAVMTQGDFVSYTWPELMHHAKQLVKATVKSNYQIALLAAGILAYTAALVAFLSVG